MEYIIIILSTYLLSTAIFIFSVVKGGINKKFLFTDNIILGTTASVVNILTACVTEIPLWVIVPFTGGFVVLVLYIFIFLYRFFRNPTRKIPGDSNDFVSSADGRIIYIKEIEVNQMPVSVKKLRISSLEEITKTDILKRPCYLIGIAMTLFDVHYNRSPLEGRVILVKHTEGTAIGLNTPVSNVSNERNTVVFESNDGIIAGIVQIAARVVRRCIVVVKEGDQVKRGQIIGKIRWGSQLDMIIPRNCEILVREGDQVYAGSTIIAKLIK